MNASDAPRLRLRVASRVLAADNIVAFELESADGLPLPEFSAGAHLEIDCGGYLRHYSLCGDPRDPMRYTIAVQLEPDGRGGSRYLYEKVAVGAVLDASAPRNHFPLAPFEGGAPATVLIGGGIGITPLLAMAWTLHDAGEPFVLHAFASHPTRHVFADTLAQVPWSASLIRHTGRCDDFAPLVGTFSEGRQLYVCGPFAMIDAVRDTARALGWPDVNVHFERFAAPAASAADAADDAGTPVVDTAFEVEIASSGQRITVAADQSVCAALRAQGITIPMSCEQGVCGVCLTGVLSGTPDHRDWVLSDAEQAANDLFTPCCSRAKTSLLVLDL